MAFVEITDVRTTARQKLTPNRRLKIWERAAGVCVLCNRKIDGVHERWIVEHIRALELGGADGSFNMAPAHEARALGRTREDHRHAAQSERQKSRYISAEVSKRPLPFGGASCWKRTPSGKIVPQ